MSGTNICSDLYSDPALTYVDAGWDKFTRLIDSSYSLATAQISNLNNFTVQFHTWDASFTATGVLSGFHRPTRPDYPSIAVPNFAITIPDAPTVSISPITIEAAPAEPTYLLNPPVINQFSAPEPFDQTRPGSAPTLNIGDAPTAPTLTLPSSPSLEAIVIPDAPNITITTFNEIAPIFSAATPSETINFTETSYVSSLLDTVRSQITRWINDGGLLPPNVASRLWERAISRDDISALKFSQEAREQFSSMGWDEPNGILSRRMMEVQQANRSARSNINRDIYIQDETVAIENLKFAVQAGLGLETTLLQSHLAVQQRKFEFAVKVKDVAIAVFNANVAAFNATVQAYNSRVEAYKAFLDGLRAQVDVYRAQVEAAKIKGDINEQLVRRYAEEVRGRLALAEMYRAQIEGFKAGIDAQRSRIDGFRAEVDSYRALSDAHKSEWDGYRAQLEAEAAKGTLFETMTRAYGTRVSAWQTKAQVRIEENRSNLLNSDALLRQHDSSVKVQLARIEALRAQLQAQTANIDAIARIYASDVQAESTAVDADNRSYSAETERGRARVELALRDAQLQIEHLNQRAGLVLRAYESAGQGASQLSASAFSAMNFTASVTSGQTRSKSCDTNFNYSGEIKDAGV